MSASNRGALLVAFLVLFSMSWWTVLHAADRRFSGGFGSGFSPGTRRFWAVVTGIVALVGAVLTLTL